MDTAIVLLFILVGAKGITSAAPSSAQLTLLKRPDPSDVGRMARWLVASNVWGVTSTISVHLNGTPFGNVVSYSDGPSGNSSGIPYFYLTKLDPTAVDLAANPLCSLTISEWPLGTCGDRDVENPTCAKITLSGQMQMLDANSSAAQIAAEALFSKHPEMREWPKDHNFQFYKLDIQNIFLIDFFGGAKPLSVAAYLQINLVMQFFVDEGF
eukprot:c43027_g1_i1 orf=374-1006(+)